MMLVRHILKLFTYLGLIFTSGILPSGFRNKIPHTFLTTLIRATCLTHSISLICSRQYCLVNITDCEVCYRAVFPGSTISYVLDPNIFPSAVLPKAPT
jgi:hypothetical protein